MSGTQMKVEYLIDTVIIIDHLNGIEAGTLWLESLKASEAVISVITLSEVLVGAGERDKPAIELFLGGYRCLPLDEATARLAADLRKENRWKLPDAFQAALATIHGLRLATRNTKDFSDARHPFVTVPYNLSLP